MLAANQLKGLPLHKPLWQLTTVDNLEMVLPMEATGEMCVHTTIYTSCHMFNMGIIITIGSSDRIGDSIQSITLCYCGSSP